MFLAMKDFYQPGHNAAYARNAMVATSSALASLEAINTLKAGGNALDAAITAAAVLCVCEPHMTGIGGDCFCLLSLPDGTLKGFNGSGRSSRHATGNWLATAGFKNIACDSIHAITVPGAIDAWDQLLAAHGTMNLGDVLEPAISHARNGITVGARTAYDWAGQKEKLNRDEGSRKHLLAGGKSPAAGDTFRFPALAGTLEAIARNGRDAFYQGDITRDMLALLASQESLLDDEDFASTSGTWVTPLSSHFAGHDILELPPNAQGITALVALNILQRLNLPDHDPASPGRWHLQIEAIRQATILQHRHIADPQFMDIDPAGLLSSRLADQLAARISPDSICDATLPAITPGASDTVYLCVMDENGMAVSFINSLYQAFGSGRTTVKTGITLQNRGACFTATPGHPNCIGPAKRPRHTIIPAMIRKAGKTRAVFGVMGGAYQPTGHVSVLVNRLIYNMNPQAALDHPRLFETGGEVLAEPACNRELLSSLAQKGHRITPAPYPLGGGQYIEILPGSGNLAAGSDPRKDGLAIGF